jgi:hypothetical protein
VPVALRQNGKIGDPATLYVVQRFLMSREHLHESGCLFHIVTCQHALSYPLHVPTKHFSDGFSHHYGDVLLMLSQRGILYHMTYDWQNQARPRADTKA